jgi:hypothetical protein
MYFMGLDSTISAMDSHQRWIVRRLRRLVGREGSTLQPKNSPGAKNDGDLAALGARNPDSGFLTECPSCCGKPTRFNLKEPPSMPRMVFLSWLAFSFAVDANGIVQRWHRGTGKPIFQSVPHPALPARANRLEWRAYTAHWLQVQPFDVRVQRVNVKPARGVAKGLERFGLVSEFLEGTTSRAKAENATWPRSVITGTGTPEEMEHGMNHRTLIARNRDHKQQNAKVHQVAKKYLGVHRTWPYGRALNYPPFWAIAFTHNGQTDTPQPTRSVGTGKGTKRVGGAGERAKFWLQLTELKKRAGEGNLQQRVRMDRSADGQE